VHRFRQLGSTYSLVGAVPDAGSICDAIKNGRVGLHAEPMSMGVAALVMAQLLTGDFRKGRLRQAPAGHP
jgi:hypothetical protein